jgi:hypothetical protein
LAVGEGVECGVAVGATLGSGTGFIADGALACGGKANGAFGFGGGSKGGSRIFVRSSSRRLSEEAI